MTPFYKKALQLFARTQTAQIEKGLAKYPEPFNPLSWTPEELLNHALEETVDLTHYLVGLKDLLDAKEQEIRDLKAEHAYEVKHLRKKLKQMQEANAKMETLPLIRTPKKSPFEDQDIPDHIKKYKSNEGWSGKGRTNAYFNVENQND